MSDWQRPGDRPPGRPPGRPGGRPDGSGRPGPPPGRGQGQGPGQGQPGRPAGPPGGAPRRPAGPPPSDPRAPGRGAPGPGGRGAPGQGAPRRGPAPDDPRRGPARPPRPDGGRGAPPGPRRPGPGADDPRRPSAPPDRRTRRGAPPADPSDAATDEVRVGRTRRGGSAATGAGATGRRGRRRAATEVDDEVDDYDGGGSRRERREARRGRGGGRPKPDRKRGRKRTRRALIVVAVILLPFILVGGWFAYQLRPGSQGKPIVVQVEEGWGASEIGDVLANKGVIDSALVFQVWATITRAGPFQAGSYQMHEGIGVRAAAGRLEEGPRREPDVKLLLPPGLRLDQIADRIGKLPGRSAEKVMELATSGTIRSKFQPADVTSLEGLLFPDTYFIGADEDEEAILQRLVARFDEIGDKVGLAASTRVTPFQAIVVASLIQTEAKLAEDAPLISAVIYNRLRDGMQLQIDATLCYSKGGCPPSPTDADKQLDSPYNTYKIAGLPPTPISSVTEASLAAALAPADVPYKFYVIADANGKHAFGTTLEEHDRNVAAARAAGLL